MYPKQGDKYKCLKTMGAVEEGDVLEITMTFGSGLIGKTDKHENISFAWDDFDEDEYPGYWEKL